MASRFLVSVLAGLSFSALAWADSPTFENISKADLKTITEDLGGLQAHTTVSPASTLGKIFGFEVGLIAGAAKTPGVEDLVHEADPDSDVEMLPQAGLFGAISLPLGFKVELLMLPEKEIEDIEFKYTSAAVQWTMTDSVVTAPFDMALKAFVSSSEFGFTQEVSGTPANVNIDTKIKGLQFIASKALAVFEPYAGIGVVKVDGDLKISGSNSFLDSGAQSSSTDSSGSQVFVGANLNLLILKLGLEVGRVFDATKANLKVSFYF